MAHADVHILGSKQGYTTLAAGTGVTAAERSELEVLSFGDLASAEAIARLVVRSVVNGRRLRSGRFAISRMLPGLADDAGRPTIEVVTLLLDARSYAEVVRGLSAVVRDVGFWQAARERAEAGVDVRVADGLRPVDDPGVLRAFDLWIAARSRGDVGLLPESESDAVLSMVGRLSRADLERCRWGIGTTSVSTPVDVCAGALPSGAHAERGVVRPRAEGGWYVTGMAEVARLADSSGTLPESGRVTAAVAQRTVEVGGEPLEFDGHREESSASDADGSRRSRRVVIAGACAIATWTLFAGLLLAYLSPGGKVQAGGPEDRGAADDVPSVEVPNAERSYADSRDGADAPDGPDGSDGYDMSPPVVPPPTSPADNVQPVTQPVVVAVGPPVPGASTGEPSQAPAPPPVQTPDPAPGEAPSSGGDPSTTEVPPPAPADPPPPVAVPVSSAPAASESKSVAEARQAIRDATEKVGQVAERARKPPPENADRRDLNADIAEFAKSLVEALTPVVAAHFRLQEDARRAMNESDAPDTWPNGGFMIDVGHPKVLASLKSPKDRDDPPRFEESLANDWITLVEAILQLQRLVVDDLPKAWWPRVTQMRGRQGQPNVPRRDEDQKRKEETVEIVREAMKAALERMVHSKSLEDSQSRTLLKIVELPPTARKSPLELELANLKRRDRP